MSLKYAILGLLSFKSQTGYEIKANFKQSIRYIWNADQAQIYRTLSEIEKQGLAESEIIQQKGRPNKKMYKITKEGLVDLKCWLSNPVQPKDQNNSELLQVFFAGQISDEIILNNLKHLRENIKSSLYDLSSLESSSELFNPVNSSKRINYFFKMTLKLGKRNSQMNLEWINEIIDRIENGEFSKE